MAKFRKKPVVVEASQWFKDGDHHAVINFEPQWGVGSICEHCGVSTLQHGWLGTRFDGRILFCPGAWIVTDENGEHSVVKPDVFEVTYEPEDGDNGTV